MRARKKDPLMPYFKPILGLEVFEKAYRREQRLNTIQHSTSSRSQVAESQLNQLSRVEKSEVSGQVTSRESQQGLSLPPVRSPTAQDYFTFKPHCTSRRYGQLQLNKLFKMVTDQDKFLNSYVSPTNIQKPLTDASKIQRLLKRDRSENTIFQTFEKNSTAKLPGVVKRLRNYDRALNNSVAVPKISDLVMKESGETGQLTDKERAILGRKYNNSKTTVKSIDSQLEIVVNEDLDLRKSNFFQSKKIRDLQEEKAKQLKLREVRDMHKVVETPEEHFASSKKASRLLPVHTIQTHYLSKAHDTDNTQKVFPSFQDSNNTDLNQTLMISQFKATYQPQPHTSMTNQDIHMEAVANSSNSDRVNRMLSVLSNTRALEIQKTQTSLPTQQSEQQDNTLELGVSRDLRKSKDMEQVKIREKMKDIFQMVSESTPHLDNQMTRSPFRNNDLTLQTMNSELRSVSPSPFKQQEQELTVIPKIQIPLTKLSEGSEFQSQYLLARKMQSSSIPPSPEHEQNSESQEKSVTHLQQEKSLDLKTIRKMRIINTNKQLSTPNLYSQGKQQVPEVETAFLSQVEHEKSLKKMSQFSPKFGELPQSPSVLTPSEQNLDSAMREQEFSLKPLQIQASGSYQQTPQITMVQSQVSLAPLDKEKASESRDPKSPRKMKIREEEFSPKLKRAAFRQSLREFVKIESTLKDASSRARGSSKNLLSFSQALEKRQDSKRTLQAIVVGSVSPKSSKSLKNLESQAQIPEIEETSVLTSVLDSGESVSSSKSRVELKAKKIKRGKAPKQSQIERMPRPKQIKYLKSQNLQRQVNQLFWESMNKDKLITVPFDYVRNAHNGLKNDLSALDNGQRRTLIDYLLQQESLPNRLTSGKHNTAINSIEAFRQTLIQDVSFNKDTTLSVQDYARKVQVQQAKKMVAVRDSQLRQVTEESRQTESSRALPFSKSVYVKFPTRSSRMDGFTENSMAATNISFMPDIIKVEVHQNQAAVVGQKLNLSRKRLDKGPSKISMGTNTKMNITEEQSDQNVFGIDQAAQRELAQVNQSDKQQEEEVRAKSPEREKVLIKVRNLKQYESHEEYSLLQSYLKNTEPNSQMPALKIEDGGRPGKNEKEEHEHTMLNQMSSQEIHSQKDFSPDFQSKNVMHIDSPKIQSSLDSGGKAKTLFRQSHFKDFNMSPRHSIFEEDYDHKLTKNLPVRQSSKKILLQKSQRKLVKKEEGSGDKLRISKESLGIVGSKARITQMSNYQNPDLQVTFGPDAMANQPKFDTVDSQDLSKTLTSQNGLNVRDGKRHTLMELVSKKKSKLLNELSQGFSEEKEREDFDQSPRSLNEDLESRHQFVSSFPIKIQTEHTSKDHTLDQTSFRQKSVVLKNLKDSSRIQELSDLSTLEIIVNSRVQVLDTQTSSADKKSPKVIQKSPVSFKGLKGQKYNKFYQQRKLQLISQISKDIQSSQSPVIKEIAELIQNNNFNQVEPKLVSLSSIQTCRDNSKDLFSRSFAKPFIQNSIMNPKALKHWRQAREKKEQVFNFTFETPSMDQVENPKEQSPVILSSLGEQSKIPTVANSEQVTMEIEEEPVKTKNKKEDKGSGENSEDEQIKPYVELFDSISETIALKNIEGKLTLNKTLSEDEFQLMMQVQNALDKYKSQEPDPIFTHPKFQVISKRTTNKMKESLKPQRDNNDLQGAFVIQSISKTSLSPQVSASKSLKQSYKRLKTFTRSNQKSSKVLINKVVVGQKPERILRQQSTRRILNADEKRPVEVPRQKSSMESRQSNSSKVDQWERSQEVLESKSKSSHQPELSLTKDSKV